MPKHSAFSGSSLVSMQPRQQADKNLDELVNCLMETKTYLDNSHRVTLSLHWLVTIESILTSHLSHSKASISVPVLLFYLKIIHHYQQRKANFTFLHIWKTFESLYIYESLYL